jgi:hypothetical protein
VTVTKFQKIQGYNSQKEEFYLNNRTGRIAIGNYKADGLIKIAIISRNIYGNLEPTLLPTYQIDSEIYLKRKRDIVGYRVVFYDRLSIEENYNLIKKHCYDLHSTPKAMNFLATHSKELMKIFKNKENYDYYMLQLFFEFDMLPYEFEIAYKGELINMSTAKKLWQNNSKE